MTSRNKTFLIASISLATLAQTLLFSVAGRDRPYYDPVGNYPPGYSGYAAEKDEQVVDAATEKYGPADRRPVLIHGQFEREDQVDSYKRLGVFPSIFPMHTFYWGDWHRDHTIGPELGDNISPAGWYRQRGIMFTSHHDAPVAFPDSMRVLDATVTRHTHSGDMLGPEQRISTIDGLKALTIWAAYQQFEEDEKGTIEVGKLADLVILSEDPTAVDDEMLDTIKVTETVKEGNIIFTLEQRLSPSGRFP